MKFAGAIILAGAMSATAAPLPQVANPLLPPGIPGVTAPYPPGLPGLTVPISIPGVNTLLPFAGLTSLQAPAAIESPTLLPTNGASSLNTMIHGALAFSPNFLTGNFGGVATNLAEMVVGAASYPFTWFVPGTPKRVVDDEGVPAEAAPSSSDQSAQ
jgi:hypothetical protein